MRQPTTTHWWAAKQLLHCLKGTIYHSLHFKWGNNLSLHAYSTTDWAGDNDTLKLTSSYLIYLGPNLISWSTRKQKTVARSYMEAEYRVVATTTTQLSLIQSLLVEFGHNTTRPSTLYFDNLGTAYFCANPCFPFTHEASIIRLSFYARKGFSRSACSHLHLR